MRPARASRAAALAGALLVVGLVGCRERVVVLGDSNSCIYRNGCVGLALSWPGRLVARPGWPGWTVVNRALPGMLAGTYDDAAPLGNGEPAGGRWHLERLIGEDLAGACTPVLSQLAPGPRRKVILALGTNDVRRGNTSGFQTGQAVLALYDRARQVPCVDVFVATIPPQRDVEAEKIARANATIRRRVPADHVIPFATEPDDDLGPDGLHVTDAAQERRAGLAFAVLVPGPAGR